MIEDYGINVASRFSKITLEHQSNLLISREPEYDLQTSMSDHKTQRITRKRY